jgi:ribosome maturation factor RimP
MTLEEKIANLIKETIEDLGYKLVKVKLHKEMGRDALSIFIDKEDDKISLKDCEIVSRAIEPILDEADLIKTQYYLIVSSRGNEV